VALPLDRRRGIIAGAVRTAESAASALLFNAALAFDREAARGFRLDIAAGTAVRFEPGQSRSVQLVALAGERKVYGFRGLIQGEL